MKRVLFIIMILLTTACAPAATAVPPVVSTLTPTKTPAPIPTSTPRPTEAPASPKLPAASFESETYINEKAGFALDYPAGWVVKENVAGERGSQVQFLSSSEIAEMVVLPKGATRVTAVSYQWEPKNDLPAYVANWKTTWESSGFTILEEQPLVLDLGLNAVQFKIKTPDSSAIVLITTLGDHYLVLSGEGNLKLSREILQRLRPISIK
jgi:hypothetical protein